MSPNERHVPLPVNLALEPDGERAARRQRRLSHATDQFRSACVLNQVRNRDHQQAVLAGEFGEPGTRAIVPSSFMTSQIMPAGGAPAMRARSTAASV